MPVISGTMRRENYQYQMVVGQFDLLAACHACRAMINSKHEKSQSKAS